MKEIIKNFNDLKLKYLEQIKSLIRKIVLKKNKLLKRDKL